MNSIGKNENELKTLYLTVGKEVSLSFKGDGSSLKFVRLSVNKLAEIIRNGLVDRHSIFEIDEISLITKSNYTTTVKVVNGKQMLSGDCESVDISVDKNQTKRKAAGKDIFTSGDFIFYVQENQLTKDQLHTLNVKNAKSYENESGRVR